MAERAPHGTQFDGITSTSTTLPAGLATPVDLGTTPCHRRYVAGDIAHEADRRSA
jgi:hypothetical protein